jgi:AcrR family transcriptional regulator
VTTTGEVPKRRYDNTRRRERANETRERIVTAGAELVRQSSISDWRGVTISAVADRAGVNERTVYRHFTNERGLRDAVMQRLEEAVGIDLAQLKLDRIADATERIVRHIATYPPGKRPPLDPTLAEANRRQHEALLGAVAEHTAGWPAEDRRLAAALLDLLWSVSSYERLARDWSLDADESVRGLTWVIGLIEAAIRAGEPPPRAVTPGTRQARRRPSSRPG